MKKLWKKYFDFNSNNKVDWWEIFLPIFFILLFEITAGILSNYIYDLLK